MNVSASMTTPGRLRSALTARFTLPIVLLGAVLLGLVGWRAWEAYRAAQLPGRPVPAAAIEEEWGVQVAAINVTAAGGLIDFRMRIIDPNKAQGLLSVADRPRLIVEDTGRVVDSLMHPPHSHELTPGTLHFLIYNNTGGAIQPGDSVSVLLGDLRLEHVIAR